VAGMEMMFSLGIPIGDKALLEDKECRNDYCELYHQMEENS